MTPIIPGIIGPQNFEIIRDQIGGILSVEFAGQYAQGQMASPPIAGPPQLAAVEVERFIPYDTQTELPRINVNVGSGIYDNVNQRKADGTYLYNIDIYTAAGSTPGTEGDKASMLLMSRIAGMVWSILSYPGYANLGLAPGTIATKQVQRLMILNKAQVPDALSDVVGRMVLMVRCIETVNLATATSLVNILTTTSLLGGDEFGYFWATYENFITPAATGTTLSNPFFGSAALTPTVTGSIFANAYFASNYFTEIVMAGSTYKINTDFTVADGIVTGLTFGFTSGTPLKAVLPVESIVIGGSTYSAYADFTQAGNTITASTFEFTNGVPLIATT